MERYGFITASCPNPGFIISFNVSDVLQTLIQNDAKSQLWLD